VRLRETFKREIRGTGETIETFRPPRGCAYTENQQLTRLNNLNSLNSLKNPFCIYIFNRFASGTKVSLESRNSLTPKTVYQEARLSEVYKLDCYGCGHKVTVAPVEGAQPCPLCGAMLRIAWNVERQKAAGRPA
jgi:hypothetical protein